MGFMSNPSRKNREFFLIFVIFYIDINANQRLKEIDL
jgi:hypothetical protein